jgi:hypothetical protein
VAGRILFAKENGDGVALGWRCRQISNGRQDSQTTTAVLRTAFTYALLQLASVSPIEIAPTDLFSPARSQYPENKMLSLSSKAIKKIIFISIRAYPAVVSSKRRARRQSAQALAALEKLGNN